MSNDETTAEAGNFAKQIKATFPVLHDPKNAVFGKFAVSPIPANVVVGRNGKVVAAIEGADIKKLNAAVAAAMK